MAEIKGRSEVAKNHFHDKLFQLSEIMHSLTWEKDGKNMHQQYKYVSEAQYKNHFKKALDQVGLIWESNCVSYEFIPSISEKMHLVFATFRATITDPITSDRREYTFIGSGSDNGDKALYKAYTGGLKFFLANTFLVAENNDPERDINVGLPNGSKAERKKQKILSSQERLTIGKELTNAEGAISNMQRKSLNQALIQLRRMYTNEDKQVTNKNLFLQYEPFVKECIQKSKTSLTKIEAEEILESIRKKIAEIKE